MRIFFVAILVSILLATGLQAQTQPDDEVIKVDINLVSVPVVVSDRAGRYVSGLKAEDFTLYQDGKKQNISFFGTEEEPLNVALLLDTSKSTHTVLKQIKSAAKDFVKLLGQNDRAMIVTFDYQVNVLSPLTSDRKVLEKAIGKAEVGEQFGTVMRDAVQEVVSRSFANVKGRKAIVLLTDGKDVRSYLTKEELLDNVEESDVMIYSVFYKTYSELNKQQLERIINRRRNGGIFGGMGGRGRMGGGMGRFPNGGGAPNRFPNGREIETNEDAMDYLEQLSDSTAGRFYEKEVTDLKKTFELIADELRKQYRLGFYPDKLDNAKEVYQLKVTVSVPNVAVRSRMTYRSRK